MDQRLADFRAARASNRASVATVFGSLANLGNKALREGSAFKKKEIMGEFEMSYMMILDDDLPVMASLRQRLAELFPDMEKTK